MTTYTVFFNDDSTTARRGLSVHAAAVEMLTYDGHDYEIRPEADGRGFRLWTCQPVANRRWEETVVFSLEADEAAATIEIMQRVVDFKGRRGGSWAGDCMPDTDFDQMLADLAEDVE
jgi:hypothetical protein